jgi:hypothetical protein
MDRDAALRVDAMLMGIRASLDALAHYVKNNAPEDEFNPIRRLIGASMAETISISNLLHEKYPNIVPKELKQT